MAACAAALLLLLLWLPLASSFSTTRGSVDGAQLFFDVDKNEHVRIHLHQSNPPPPPNTSVDKKKPRTTTKSQAVLEYEEKVAHMHQQKRAKPSVPALNVIFVDEVMAVVNKASGVMCVPDINKNPSLLDLVWEHYGSRKHDTPSSMIVNRLDMDTSGLVVFGRTPDATKALNEALRERSVAKEYEALLCGHVPFPSGLIDLPLQRDHERPPFMRVSTPTSAAEASRLIEELKQAGYKKQGRKNAKPSQTEFKVIEHSTIESLPVTRVRLQPHTGRTHQLRVHCAAMGHPIVGDPTYGVNGDANMFGGLKDAQLIGDGVQRTPIDIQEAIAQVHVPNVDPMCLHAAFLRLQHPITGDTVEWRAPVPF